MKFKDIYFKCRVKLNRLISSLLGQKAKAIYGVELQSVEKRFLIYQGVVIDAFTEEAEISEIKCEHLPSESFEAFCPFNASTDAIFLDIQNSSFRFSNNLLITSDNQVVFAEGFSFNQLLISKNYLSYNVKYLKGTIAYLSNTWVDNYYHWLIFTLPLLRIYLKYVNIESIDYFYLGETIVTSFQQETLRMAGVPSKKIVTSPCYSNRMLMAFSLVKKHSNGRHYRSFHDYLFTKSLITSYLTTRKSRTKRIYVCRGKVKTRRVKNEKEVINFLSSLNFVPIVMENRSVLEQADVFKNADAVIALHGAALTNLVFCDPSTTVIEILPENNNDLSHFTNSCFADLNYLYIKCKEVDQTVEIDLTKLRCICKYAGL